MSLSREVAQSYIKLCEEGYDKNTVADSLISFLEENKLDYLKDRVLDEVETIEKEQKEYNSLHIKSAYSIDKDTIKKISEKVCGEQEVEHVLEEDKELIAGFVARFRSEEWDSSVKGSIERLRGVLKEQ